MSRYWLVTTPHYHPASVNRRGDGWPKLVSQSRVVLRVVGIEFLPSSLPFPPPFSSSSPPPCLVPSFTSPSYRSFTLPLTPCKVHGNVGFVVIERLVVVLRGKRAAFPFFFLSSLSFPRLPPGRGGRREESWWIFARGDGPSCRGGRVGREWKLAGFFHGPGEPLNLA